jgi:hypothetical protein
MRNRRASKRLCGSSSPSLSRLEVVRRLSGKRSKNEPLHVAPEEARQDGVDIGRVAQHDVAAREFDPHRWKLVVSARRVGECGTARE